MTLLVTLLLLQGPGDAWTMAPGPPREVKRVYWDLFQETEVWILLLPESPGEPSRVNLVLQAFYPGRAKRDPQSGLPKWPKGEPKRLALKVLPFPLTVIRDLSLRLVVDGESLDLGASCVSPDATGPPCQLLFPCSDGCMANGVSVEVQPVLLQRLAKARVVTGTALGFPIVLSAEDLSALGKLVQTVHLDDP